MTDAKLSEITQDDVDNLVEHLRELGRREAPLLDPLDVCVFIGQSLKYYSIEHTGLTSLTDDAITIIRWLGRQEDAKYLLEKCSLHPKRVSMGVRDGRFELTYQHEHGTDKVVNIIGCEVREEDQFGVLRAKTSLYAQWVRGLDEDERTARRFEEGGDAGLE